jgi:glycosyltransferase involved in cell wall biosynthesis
MRILLVGTMPPPSGGTTILLKLLLEQLFQCQGIEVFVVNTGGLVGGLLRLSLQLLRRIPSCDVVTIHLSRPSGALGILFLARLFHKPVVLRFFGGADPRESSRAVDRLCFKPIIRQAELTLFETKRLVAIAKGEGARRVEWYSNYRQMTPGNDIAFSPKTHCRRFVFLGHVNKVKGVPEIIAVDNIIPNDARIDIYGPLTNGFSERDFLGLQKIKYCGEICPDKVLPTLSEYDALLLPTYHSGEGYPGVILEAFAAGIPIITTAWLSIPEIADDSCAMLIPPKNSQALAEAMNQLYYDNALYLRLCKGSAAKRNQFCARQWTGVFLKYCCSVVSESKEAK